MRGYLSPSRSGKSPNIDTFSCGQGQRAGTSTEASPARKIRSAKATSTTEGQTAMRCVACGTEFQRVDLVDLSPGSSGHEQRILACLLHSGRACAIQGRKLQKTHDQFKQSVLLVASSETASVVARGDEDGLLDREQAPRMEDEIVRVDCFQNIAWETRTYVNGARFDHISKRALFQKTLRA